MNKITYVTGNPLKVKVAKAFLEPLNIEVNNVKIECPEIQADTCEEVATFSSKWASNELKVDVLKNDSALIIPALKNFPGPYTRYIEETIGEDGILALMQEINDRYAYLFSFHIARTVILEHSQNYQKKSKYLFSIKMLISN